jgi:succinylglutamate desuccinylase
VFVSKKALLWYNPKSAFSMEISTKKNYIKIDSGIPGPKSIIFAGVHGDEICGVKAFQKVLSDLVINKGSAVFVIANPEAIEKNVRFTEFNLNRSFKEVSEYTNAEKETYEYKRAQVLKQYLDDADVLLDIHASFTPESEPFVICERNADAITEYFPVIFKKIVYGFDAIEPGGTDFYMNRVGKIGICAECGYLLDPNAVDLAVEVIMSFLRAREHVNNEGAQKISDTSRDYIQMTELYHTKTDFFILTRPFADFEEIKAGELIAIDGDEKIFGKKDCSILFAHEQNEKGTEGFLLGEKVARL